MKFLLTTALAAVAALVLGFGVQSSTPSAHADTTGNQLVGCELVAGGIDGLTNNVTTIAEIDKACGVTTPAAVWLTEADLKNLDKAYGDNDGKLESDDLADRSALDGDQIRNTCTNANPPAGVGLVPTPGYQCTLLMFVFVDDEKAVTLDLPTGLASIENGTLDYICTVDEGGAAGMSFVAVGDVRDDDCSDALPANNGDGVVVFHIVNGNAAAGATPTVRVLQEGVETSAQVNVVGPAHDVALTLAEDVIQVSGSSVAAISTCQTTNDVRDADSLSQENTTIAIAVVTDLDDTPLTRVSVALSTDDQDVARIAIGDTLTEVIGNTGQSVDSGSTGVAQFAVICGGRETGTVDVNAVIGSVTDRDTQELTVVGEPAEVVLAAAPASIACDGTATSTVTATVTDSDGNNVANGVEVSFDVVALGTANPINVDTEDGTASSVITPLSNSSAGVTVLVTAGDVERSIRVDCSIPIAPQPTVGTGGAVPTATPRTGIVGPDTGNGGYIGQDSSGFPTWTLLALAIGSVALVAGGLVTRKVTK